MTGFDKGRIEARKLGRRAAYLLRDLLDDVPNNYGADYADALCEELRSMFPKKAEPAPKKPAPFVRLARTQIPFGKHWHKSFDEIDHEDPDYLDWLCQEQEDFLRILKEYMTHPERGRT